MSTLTTPLRVTAAVVALAVLGGCTGGGPAESALPAWTATREHSPRSAENVPTESISGCPAGAGEVQCLQTWAIERLDGGVEALDTVVAALSLRTYGDEAFFVGACHDVWHEVGKHAGTLYDLPTIVERWPYSCHGGLLHGAASTRAQHVGMAVYTTEIATLCAAYTEWAPILRNDCYHAVGHGYGWLEEWETLFDGCNAMRYTGEAFDWCATGVMESVVERFTAGSFGTGSAAERTPESLCLRLDAEKDVCWRYIMFPLLADGLELPAILDRCAAYGSDDRERCSFAVGGIAGSGWADGGADTELCAALDGVCRDACWQGAARVVARISERASLQPFERELELPQGWRLSLCPVIPEHLRAACAAMEAAEIGDELDQYDQHVLGAAWRRAHGVVWPGIDQT